MDGDTDAADDERSIELSSIAAIFPELTIDPKNPFSAALELPVELLKPVSVKFPLLTSTAAATTQDAASTSEGILQHLNGVPIPLETRQISHFPSLRVKLDLPEGYPEELPPIVKLNCDPPWISRSKLAELEEEARTLWTDLGRNLVVYDYLDYLQGTAEQAFGLLPEDDTVFELPIGLEIALLDYDLKAKRSKFDKATFDCGICLEPKKGDICYKMQDCGHVFCVECLQSFYNNCITEGDVYSVKCLAPDCERKSIVESPASRIVKTLDASELIQIPLEQAQVQRYVDMLKKKRLESNKDTIYCPRKWCQGPARSSRKSTTTGEAKLNTEKSPMTDAERKKALPPPAERVCVCEDCGFAFCCVCNQGWHGEFAPCFPRSAHELTIEELASENYLRKHSQSCPTCRARCQKTMGCNHMKCFQCETHFCYLCRAVLDQENPYKHFNTPHQECYMRLWVMEEGDGEPDEFPGRRPAEDQIAAIQEDELDEADNLQQQEAPQQPLPPAPVPPNRNDNPPRVRFNRRAQQGLERAPRVHNNFNGLQRFLAMAANDQEDDWDSDELDDLDDI